MPVERCALDQLEQAVEKIEKKSRIVALSVTGGAVVIVTEPKTRTAPGERETR